MNAKRMIAVVAVLAMAFAALAFVPAEENSAADEKEIVYFEGGELSSTLTGTSTQKVIIQKDLVIKAGGKILIEGDLEIPTGVTVTIEDGTAVQGKGIFTIIGNAVIDGTITSKVADGLYIEPGTVAGASGDYTVTVNGTINAFGNATGTSVKTVTLIAAPATTNSKVILVNGAVNVGSNAEASFYCVMFNQDAVLNVFGIANGIIYTSGTVNFDGATDSIHPSINALGIFITNATAVVNIVKVAGYIDVTDAGMFAYTHGGIQYYIGRVPSYINPTSGSATVAAVAKGSGASDLNLRDLTNIKVTVKITTEIEDGEMSENTEMCIAPLDLANAVGPVDKPITSVGAEIRVLLVWTIQNTGTVCIDTMVVDDVAILIQGKATVSGEITYLKSTSKTFTVDNSTHSAELKVDGLVLMKDGQTIGGNGKLIAATYTIQDEKNNVDTYYTSLSKAIAADAKDITMLGQLIVDEDIKVPAGTKVTTYDSLDQSPALADANCAAIIKENATLTILSGAQFDAKGDVKVEGIFIIENLNYGIKFNSKLIWADVEFKNGPYAKYTNIHNALSSADAGSELNAYNPWGGWIVIKDDLAIPAGISFSNTGAIEIADDGKMKGIDVYNGVTLTVNGKLIINDPEKLVAEENEELGMGEEGVVPNWYYKTTIVDDGKVYKCSVIALGSQGIIEFTGGQQLTYETFYIAGAYYVIDNKNCVSGIPLAFSGILDTDDKSVYIVGDVTIDTSVSGTEKERITVYISKGDVTLKGFTFAYGSIVVKDGVTLTGDIGTATGKMILKSAQSNVTFSDVFIDDAMNLQVTGNISSNNPAEVAGTVYLRISYDAIQNGIPEEEFKLLTFADKRFIIPAGSSVFIVSGTSYFSNVELLVEGELTVMKNGKLEVVSRSIMSVTGTFTVPRVDSGYGTAKIANLIVGGSTDTFDAFEAKSYDGNAIVAGDGKFETNRLQGIFVFSGATVSADVLKVWMDDGVSTEFFVDGAPWMTAFAHDDYSLRLATTTYEVTLTDLVPVVNYNYTPAMDNSIFKGWQTYDEKTKTFSHIIPMDEAPTPDTKAYVYVGQAGYTKVYADISKDIYDVFVVADEGIDNVYLDGILMINLGNRWFAQIEAGSHTLGYTLGNGYSGNAVITTIDGKTLVGGGLSFVVNDDKYDATAGEMVITLSGIQKSGIDIDPDTHTGQSSGLTVTEILLIVVVIIIAVMAVVLILRLNRS